MRFGLTTRVIATVVLLAVSVVALDAWVTRWAFERRFLAYIGEQERDQLERVAEALAARHAADGDLSSLADRRVLLRLLGRALLPERSGSPRDSGMLAPGKRPDAGPDLRYGGDAREPRRLEQAMRRRLGTFLPRLTIELADGRVLLAPRRDPPQRFERLEQSVVVDGEAVALLRLVPAREFVRERDRRFARDHLAAIGWIAALAAVLASITGWLLARRLLVPVQAAAAGARALAAGNHDVTLPEDRTDELGDLARDFNRLARSLAASARARERWMADVAHELRTPVAVLRGELEALQDGVRALTPEALASLEGEVLRLSRLVDDLRDLTLADAGALAHRFAATDLVTVVDAACERYRERLAGAGLTLRWTPPQGALLCRADAQRLDQLLANLLENALRYTRAPGTVRVSLAAVAENRRITVEDGPPGVDAAEFEQLFERFHRVEASRSRASGGAGLGLAIAERITVAHGGRITARASELGGLAVDVLLPAAEREG